MTSRTATIFAALLMIGVAFVSTAGAQVEEVEDLVEGIEDPEVPDRIQVGLGDAYFEDFQADDGDWDSSSPPDATGWEWGHPDETSYGPDVDPDENLWGTNLAGDFSEGECSYIESPAIDLTSPEATLATTATLSWENFFRASYLVSGGVVQIGVGGEYTNIVPEGGYWGSSPTSELDDCLQHETQESGGFGSFPSSPNDPLEPISADISDFLGEEITIRFVFASTEDPYGTQDGWFIDDVAVVLELSEDVPEQAADPGLQNPLWTADGDWEYGAPAEEGPIGQLVYATNLDEDYTEDEACSILETAVDVPVAGGELSWDQWLRSSSFRAGGVIQVVDDDGAHNIVPEEGYTTSFAYSDHDECLQHDTQGTDTMGGFEQSGDDPMETFHADISDWSGQEVTLRFAWSAQDGFSSYPGWHINNVTLDGVTLLPSAPVDLTVLPNPDEIDPEEEVENVNDTVNALIGQAESQTQQYEGWTVGGEHISWAHDEASTGPEGDMVTATNPHGVHSEEEYECSYVQSPTVPTALIGDDASLSLDHFVDMSYYDGWFSSGARTAGLILVSTDAGLSWEILETDANDKEIYYTGIYDCFEELGVPTDGDDNRAIVDEAGVIGGENGAMETLEVALDDYQDATTLTLRFAFGTGTTISAQGGWYFNNVNLGDLQLME